MTSSTETSQADIAPAEIIRTLRELGVELWTEDAALRFRAPAGVLTDSHKNTLRRVREEVIALLSAEHSLVSRPHERYEPFPLTDVQSAYLVGQSDAFDFGGVSCHGYLEVWLGDVDPDAVERAWTTLIERHDMLRAVVDPATNTQRVLPEVPPFRLRRGESAEQVRAELSHARYEPNRWPLHSLWLTPGWLLHVSVDLLIADFASVQLLVGELLAVLRGETLPEIDISFRDYVIAERAIRDTPKYAEDRDYWLRRADTLPAAPDLPVTGSAAAPRFHRLQQRIPSLRETASAHGITTSALVLAAYAETIGRFSRTKHFAINMPLQNRLALHEQVCALAGDFTSVNLLEVDLTVPEPLVDRARRLGAQLLSDLDHRLYSGVELLRELGRRDTRTAASAETGDRAAGLMPVVFTGVLDGSAADVRYGISQTPQVWIDCQAVEQADTMLVSWDVREGVLPAGLAEAAFEMFLALLTGPADARPPYPLPAAQQRTRQTANDTRQPLPSGLLHQPWLEAAQRHGERPAVIAGGHTVTHAELLSRASAVAHALAGDAATTAPGALVAITMDKGIDQIAAVLGVLMAGCAYVPIDTTQPPARRDAMLAGVDHVLTEVPAPAAASAQVPLSAAQSTDLAYVIYTSGSTGTPKGVMITHAAARNTIEDINSRFDVTCDDRVLGLAQLGFDLSVYDIFGVLGAGGCLVLPDPDRQRDPSHWAELVAAHGITIWDSVPAQAQMLADHPGGTLDSVRLALLSGDWIPVTLPQQLRTRLPQVRLISLGGATEASIWSIFHEIGDVFPDATRIRYGKPLANQQFRVVDALGQDCPDWVPGELLIGGSGVARGYRGDATLTAAKFRDGWYHTGDLGRYLPDGDIDFLGRADDQVKIRGHRIEPAEVEAALAGHPDVAAAAAVVHGSGTARHLVAFVESRLRHAGETVSVDTGRVADFARSLDAAVLAAARIAIETVGETDVAPRHRGLYRRWQRVLENTAAPDVELAAAWEQVRHLAVPALCDERLIGYLQHSAENMAALLRGTEDPVALMFPGGGTQIAEAAYRSNIMVAYLNKVVAEAVRHRHPRRVLEVGAGVGATTAEVLAACPNIGNGTAGAYTYTDVSPFLLDYGRSRFPALSFATYDIDRDPQEQGFAAGSFDLILCAGVLNNARHTGRTLAWLRELLAPGGTLVVTEPTREHYEVMASQAFMMTAPEDQRAETGCTFLTRDEWLTELAPFGEVTCLPEPGHPLEPLGQHVLVAGPSITDHLREVLPEYMIPQLIETVPALPLTGNGKIDRRTLAEMAAALTMAPEPSAEDDSPRDELERRLATIIGDVLRRDDVPRTASFFALGADSVLLSQIAGRLQQEVEVVRTRYFDSVLRQLLHQPTLAQLADYLRATEEDGPGEGPSPLVDLGGPPSDSNPVLVLVHEGLGTMAPYQRLAARLSATRRVVGLAVPNARSFTAIPTEVLIERLAADYADALLAAGHRTVHVVGYCLGGLLATELARTVTERGGTVAGLTVISSYPLEFEVDEPMVIEGTFAHALGTDPATLGYPGDTEELGRNLERVLADTPGRIPSGALDFGPLAQLTGDERVARITTNRDQFAVFSHSFHAASKHVAQPYAGDITFLRPNEGLQLLAGMSGDPTDYWARVCLGRLDIVDIPGNHFTCLAHDLTGTL
ncbi:non-ribosomal peptide synthetase [Nocardia amamiensis]|uniref:non-ribosomal peptide synthetase n=1 Tax=Nocardia amamiensis TaxID=404578 RepID=UPI00082DDDC4|nr:non-ribosomal peptide synthetase [Nocardia amamiensis]